MRQLSEIYGILKYKLEWAELLLSRNQCLSCVCLIICKDISQWVKFLKPLKINIRQLSEIYGILENKLEWAELLLSKISVSAICVCLTITARNEVGAR